MAMIDYIKLDLQKRFTEHGVTVSLMGQSAVVTNSLGEIISATPTETPQTIIIRDLPRSLESQLVGDVTTGIIDFNAPSDTLVKEENVIKYDNQLYHVRELKPRLVFGQVVCYIGKAERADG